MDSGFLLSLAGAGVEVEPFLGLGRASGAGFGVGLEGFLGEVLGGFGETSREVTGVPPLGLRGCLS